VGETGHELFTGSTMEFYDYCLQTTLEIQEAGPSEMLVTLYRSTQHYIPEDDDDLHSHCCDSLTSLIPENLYRHCKKKKKKKTLNKKILPRQSILNQNSRQVSYECSTCLVDSVQNRVSSYH
jgi:hypothetical protein